MEEILGGRRHTRETLAEAAVRYAEDRHWDVVPGTSVVETDKGRRCSCGHPACRVPGAHPLHRDWAAQAAGSPATIRRWWSQHPDAAILLPTGRAFDVIDVAEPAGCLALARLERLGLPLGPVIATPDRRLQFFVMPGARDKMPDLLRRTGWGSPAIDMVCRGDGDFVVAPPSAMGASGGATWARHPTTANRWLPEARELINPIAYACTQAIPRARDRRTTVSAR
ncbi:MAG TPA: bifunctional DNA primase/polymerase [Yinghuangia sp.]|nr:bifunctional DNA primase/polymerase [Yinghuangia sp.]